MLPNSGPLLRSPLHLAKALLQTAYFCFCSVLLHSSKPPPRLAPQTLPPATSCFIFSIIAGWTEGGEGEKEERRGNRDRNSALISLLFYPNDLQDQLLTPRGTSHFWFKLASGERGTVNTAQWPCGTLLVAPWHPVPCRALFLCPYPALTLNALCAKPPGYPEFTGLAWHTMECPLPVSSHFFFASLPLWLPSHISPLMT